MNSMNYLGMLYVDFASLGFHSIIIVTLAAIFTGILKKTSKTLPRSTYFLYLSLMTLATAIFQLLWIQGFDAIVNGYVFFIAALDVLIIIGVGYTLTVLHKARSNDAFGHSRYAVLGFIPLGNFVLLFKPSIDKTQSTKTAATTGVPAVFIGLIVLVLVYFAREEVGKAIERSAISFAQSDLSQQLASQYYQFYHRKDGLTAGLEYLASLEVPGRIDDFTELQSIRVEDGAVIYDILVTDNSIAHFDTELVQNLMSINCDFYAPAISNSGTIQFVFRSQQHGVLENIISDSTSCR